MPQYTRVSSSDVTIGVADEHATIVGAPAAAGYTTLPGVVGDVTFDDARNEEGEEEQNWDEIASTTAFITPTLGGRRGTITLEVDQILGNATHALLKTKYGLNEYFFLELDEANTGGGQTNAEEFRVQVSNFSRTYRVQGRARRAVTMQILEEEPGSGWPTS